MGQTVVSNAGDLGLISGSGRSPGEENGNLLQYSCLENSMDRPWGRKESDMSEQLTLIYVMYISSSQCNGLIWYISIVK